MIDTERRKKLAFHLRQLSNGQISNDAFEEAVMDKVSYGWLPEQYHHAKQAENDDPVIRPMLEMAWGLYDDTRNHKLERNDALSEYAQKEIARYVLFLHSNQEYDWEYIEPTAPLTRLSITNILKCILTIGQYYKILNLDWVKKRESIKRSGDFEVWPFKTRKDFERQLKKQPFLTGG